MVDRLNMSAIAQFLPDTTAPAQPPIPGINPAVIDPILSNGPDSNDSDGAPHSSETEGEEQGSDATHSAGNKCTAEDLVPYSLNVICKRRLNDNAAQTLISFAELVMFMSPITCFYTFV